MEHDIEILTSNKGRKKLRVDEYFYLRESKSFKSSPNRQVWECQVRRETKCISRLHTITEGGKIKIVKYVGIHNHEPDRPEQRAKAAALEKLREYTESAITSGENLRPMDIVRKVLSEMPPECRVAMPGEETLMKRVRRWANAKGVNPGTSLEEWAAMAEESDVKVHPKPSSSNSKQDPTPSSSKSIASSSATTKAVDNNTVVDSGAINFEPVSLSELVNPETGEAIPQPGLVFLKTKFEGRHRAMVGGQIFVWDKNIQQTIQIYKCREFKIGCQVLATLYLKERRYEVRGSHVHEYRKSLGGASVEKRKCIPNLKLVDDDGNEIRGATMEDIWAENPFENTMDSTVSESRSCQSGQEVPPPPAVPETLNFNEETNDDYMDDGGGGDDFQTEDYNDVEESSSVPARASVPVNEPQSVPKHRPGPKSKTAGYEFKTLTSSPETRTKRRTRDPNAAKTGELCFVCGDELIVSEKLACSQETFKKACYYLNVRSEQEWFPKSRNGQFYSFCESCTKEIMRIHDLYKKVEEIQSMIFQKVESVEKRIVDAEIVDHWMATAPPTTTIRYEGFRNQVMINYRNKLKLRREVRQARKLGQNLSEAQPVVTAHMFAKDPLASDSHQRVVPDDTNEQANPPSPRRTRGRPKSKKTAAEKKMQMSKSAMQDEMEHDDIGFQDFDDARSVVSEKEVKFWHEDPSKLRVTEGTEGDDDHDVGGGGDHSMDFDGGMGDDGVNDFQDNDDDDYDNDSDPDYDECDDDDDDEDWGTSRKGRKSSQGTKRSVGRPRSVSASSKNSMSKATSLESADDSNASGNVSNTVPSKAPAAPAPVIYKPPKKKKEPHLEFPETVIRRDGRIFMQGIEIIKNPPGHFPPRPYSVSFSCGECGKTQASFYRIRTHISGLHLGMYKCKICDRQYACHSEVLRHVRQAHEPAEFVPCEICGKPYKDKKQLKKHRWTHLNEEEKNDPANAKYKPTQKGVAGERFFQTFMCSYCSKTFFYPSALRRHELIHTDGEPQRQCQYCGKLYTKSKRLSEHVIKCRKQAQGITESLPCPKCPNIRFKSRTSRNKHIRNFHSNTNSSSLPFTCPKCPRSFGTKEGYRSHKRVCTENSAARRESRDSVEQQLRDLVEFKTDSNSTETSGAGPSQSQSSTGIAEVDPNAAAAAIGYNYNMFGYPGASLYPNQP